MLQLQYLFVVVIFIYFSNIIGNSDEADGFGQNFGRPSGVSGESSGSGGVGPSVGGGGGPSGISGGSGGGDGGSGRPSGGNGGPSGSGGGSGGISGSSGGPSGGGGSSSGPSGGSGGSGRPSGSGGGSGRPSGSGGGSGRPSGSGGGSGRPSGSGGGSGGPSGGSGVSGGPSGGSGGSGGPSGSGGGGPSGGGGGGGGGSDQAYCQLSQANTLCKYPAGSGCNKQRRGVDQAAIRDVVDTHNKLRQKVANGQQNRQPSASNMKEIVWSDELASVAQRWADQCKFGHDDNRVTPEFSHWVGQNVASTSSSHSDNNPDFAKGAIEQWFDEVDEFSSSVSSFAFSANTGHYTQMVWAETYAVGCGYAFYSNTKYYVCNYGPGGNIQGEPIYLTGTSCSKCGRSSCSTRYPSLCSMMNSNTSTDETRLGTSGTAAS